MRTKLKRRTSLSAQLESELRDLIDSGNYSAGDKLPTENELIQRYAVSRTVVREAISGLRADGVLETRQGVGAFVTGRSGNRLKPFEPEDLEDVLHIIDLRMALEPEAAALAALRRTAEDLKDLEAKFSELSAKALDAKAFATPDFEFHLAIARASHNPYFLQLEEHLGSKIIPHSKHDVFAPDLPQDISMLQRIQMDHEAIYRAIVDGDDAAARQAMKTHLETGRQIYGAYKDKL